MNQKIAKIVLENNLKDKLQSIHNVDENGRRLTQHHQQPVIAMKGVVSERINNVNNRCGKAVGGNISLVILVKGSEKPDKLLVELLY